MFADGAMSTHLKIPLLELYNSYKSKCHEYFCITDISLLMAQSSSDQPLLEAWTCCFLGRKLKVKGQHKIVLWLGTGTKIERHFQQMRCVCVCTHMHVCASTHTLNTLPLTSV